ncbi:hypothetical protein PMAYCL1PPCAC_20502, partial [Pristionchus mayeri]
DEVIDEATFAGKPLNSMESFSLFNDPSLGNCYTFNHFNSTMFYQSREPGPRYGLRVSLEFDRDEYAPWVESVGM